MERQRHFRPCLGQMITFSTMLCIHTLVEFTTAARHAGFNEFESFLYSATLSTFWEYKAEAFASAILADLFITPFFGAVVGEMMFEAEQDIVVNGGEVWGSETMGNVSLFFLNPVGHIHGWVSDAWGGSA